MAPLMINIGKNNFKNPDSASNLIRYITRTRPNETRQDELLAYGFNYGNAYVKPLEELIHEIEAVHRIYNSTDCLMCHYTMLISDKDFYFMENDLSRLCHFASDACDYLFQLGHQACYAIHYSKNEKLHIHFAINSVNYLTGCKLRQYPKELLKNVERPIRELYAKHLHLTTPAVLD